MSEVAGKTRAVYSATMNTPFRAVTTPEKARLTVEDFLLLDESGAFAEYTKTELLDGEIWYVNAQHTRHARTKTELAVELSLALRAMDTDLRPICEPSTRVSDHSLPEPDIVLTYYKGDHVVPLDTVALIVEITDSTHHSDLGRKLRIYARAAIPEYWVVDLPGGKIRQMWSPEGGAYREHREIALGERIEAATVVGLSVETVGLI